MRRLTVAALAAVIAAAAWAEARNVFTDGSAFYTGCNYWASNAGMYMWRRWSAAAVSTDIAVLSANGVNIMRVFPLWPDFQPLTRMLGAGSLGRVFRGRVTSDAIEFGANDVAVFEVK